MTARKRRLAEDAVWVVEMLNTWYTSRGPKWEPVVGIGLTRKQGLLKARQWREKNPDDRFRVRQYARLAAADIKRLEGALMELSVPETTAQRSTGKPG